MAKQIRVGVKSVLITGIFLIVATIVTWLLQKNNKQSKSETQVVNEQNVDSGSINNYNATRDIKIENNNFVRSLTKDSPIIQIKNTSPKNQIINNAPNQGVQINENSGIIIVPEEIEVQVENNFSITKIEASTDEQRYEFKPKQGIWYNSFFAYPLEEESVVKGEMGPKFAGVFFKNFSEETFLFEGQEIRMKVYSTSQQVNREVGVVFSCLKSPSILFFGDFSNPKKQYVVKRL